MTTPWSADGPPLTGRPIMRQWWRDIVFVHWRVDPDRVAPLLPRGTRPDVIDGNAWVGLIPFRMVDAGLGAGPAIPWLGTFLEANVRLYSVDDAGHHGVVFRSLDADRAAVVLGARLGFGTPYQWARMDVDPPDLGEDPTGREATWRVRRRARHQPGCDLTVEVGAALPEPGPVEVFLTARFGLHTRVAGRTLWVPNTHGAWPLREARVLRLDDSLVEAAGLPDVALAEPDSVLFSRGVRTEFGLPQRL